jgi:mono/diheme cytochrome c family protein
MKRFILFALVVMVGFVFAASVFAQGKAADGEKLYGTQNCKMCHSIAGKGGKVALDGVGTKLTAADIKEWIADPKAAATKAKSTAKPPMPANAKLTPADVDNLVAYLVTLKK